VFTTQLHKGCDATRGDATRGDATRGDAVAVICAVRWNASDA